MTPNADSRREVAYHLSVAVEALRLAEREAKSPRGGGYWLGGIRDLQIRVGWVLDDVREVRLARRQEAKAYGGD